MPLSIWAHSGTEIGAQPRLGLGSELSASQECYTEVRKAPGARRRALGTSTGWGWRTWVGSHLQPPDCDLSRATPRSSPDLTQSLPNSAGRPFPGLIPRRPPDATGPTQTEAIPPSLEPTQGFQQDLRGGAEGKGHLLGHLFHHPPPFSPHSICPDLRFLSGRQCGP